MYFINCLGFIETSIFTGLFNGNTPSHHPHMGQQNTTREDHYVNLILARSIKGERAVTEVIEYCVSTSNVFLFYHSSSDIKICRLTYRPKSSNSFLILFIAILFDNCLFQDQYIYRGRWMMIWKKKKKIFDWMYSRRCCTREIEKLRYEILDVWVCVRYKIGWPFSKGILLPRYCQGTNTIQGNNSVEALKHNISLTIFFTH